MCMHPGGHATHCDLLVLARSPTLQVVIYASPRNPGAKKAAQMLKRGQPKLAITQLPPIHGKKQETKGGPERFSSALDDALGLSSALKGADDALGFSSALESLTNLAETGINLTESATGIDIDRDGDVGLTAEEAARARQLLESEAADQGVMARQRAMRLDKVAGYEVPTIMLLYLNGETPSLQPLLCPASPAPLALLTPHLRPLTPSHAPVLPVRPRCTPLHRQDFPRGGGGRAGQGAARGQEGGLPHSHATREQPRQARLRV